MSTVEDQVAAEGEGGRANSWIFQANPQIYDAAAALSQLRTLTWSVRQHRDEIPSGDTACIWTSGPDGGLLAVGNVTSEPQEMRDSPEELPFYAQQPPDEPELRVQLQIDNVFVQPISRDELMEKPTLASMTLLRRPQGTNFKLTAGEARTLERLTASKPDFAQVVR